MNRAELLRTAELARAAADAATITANFANIKPAKADEYASRTEEALYAALDALAEARRTRRSSFFHIASDIAGATQTERRAA